MVRRLATERPGALLESALVLMVRQTGSATGGVDLASAAATSGLSVGYLTRAFLPQMGQRFPLRAERELRTLAEAIDLLLAGRLASLGDLLAQRLRAVEASTLEDGGWTMARHLEVIPDARVSAVPDAMREAMARAERAQLALRSSARPEKAGAGRHSPGPSREPPGGGAVAPQDPGAAAPWKSAVAGLPGAVRKGVKGDQKKGKGRGR